MPWNIKDYPANWRHAIRPALVDRAQNRCEGSPASPHCRALNHTPHPVTGSFVVLTCAHLCFCEPLCGELSHLRLLCQRCHLTLDAELHAAHAAQRHRARLEAAGQLSLFYVPIAGNPWR